MPEADSPFEVLERVNDNAYKINLPQDYGISTTFNVAHLIPYLEDDHLVNLGANSFHDGNQTMAHDLASQYIQGNTSSSTNP